MAGINLLLETLDLDLLEGLCEALNDQADKAKKFYYVDGSDEAKRSYDAVANRHWLIVQEIRRRRLAK